MSHVTKCGVRLTNQVTIGEVMEVLGLSKTNPSYSLLGVDRPTMLRNSQGQAVLVISQDGEAFQDSDWRATATERQSFLQMYSQKVLEDTAAMYGFSTETTTDVNGDLVMQVTQY